MQVALPSGGLDAYTSKAQRARIATEAWASANLYCPNCSSPARDSSVANTPAIDFQCPKCAATYQLKAQSSAFSRRIVDAAYSTMVRAIMENRTPNLFAMHYGVSDWAVEDVILIPHFAFPLSAIEKRQPLAETARRAGWVGCNILLHSIPSDARINIITDGTPVAAATVRAQYARIRPLAKLDARQRGWTLDVLNVVRSLGKPEFNLAEIYKSEEKLAHLHPANRHVRDKIRQQPRPRHSRISTPRRVPAPLITKTSLRAARHFRNAGILPALLKFRFARQAGAPCFSRRSWTSVQRKRVNSHSALAAGKSQSPGLKAHVGGKALSGALKRSSLASMRGLPPKDPAYFTAHLNTHRQSHSSLEELTV